jgi:phage terminase Nu1 subunit (DNA packaging protein)
MFIDFDKTASQESFAALVGITQPRVAQLIADGVLPRDGTLGAWLLAYAERLREQASGRGQELMIERAGLAREQRIGQRIKNAVSQGDYAPVGLLADALAAASAAMVDRFEALTNELALQCPELDEHARDVVLKVIASARNEWVRGTSLLATEIVDVLSDEADDDDGLTLTPDASAVDVSEDEQGSGP